jgi:hypothetical protein
MERFPALVGKKLLFKVIDVHRRRSCSPTALRFEPGGACRWSAFWKS